MPEPTRQQVCRLNEKSTQEHYLFSSNAAKDSLCYNTKLLYNKNILSAMQEHLNRNTTKDKHTTKIMKIEN